MATIKNYDYKQYDDGLVDVPDYPECIGWHTWLANGYPEMMYALEADPCDDYMYCINIEEEYGIAHLIPGARIDEDEYPIDIKELFEDYTKPTEGELISFEMEFGIIFPILNEEVTDVSL